MDKKILQRAIEAVDLYSKSEKSVLQSLITVSANFVAIASAKYLIKDTGLSTTTTYAALKSLQQKDMLEKSHKELNSYIINNHILERVVETYNNQIKK